MTTRYLSRIEASDHLKRKGLKVEPNTMQKYATTGGGPPFRHFGNRTVYTEPELDAWAEQKLATPRPPRKVRAALWAAQAVPAKGRSGKVKRTAVGTANDPSKVLP